MKTLHISIPKPCSENWDEMIPAEKGRFCMACQKTVIDFTQKTPAEIVAILRNSQEKVCGHFRKEQLGFYPLPEIPEPALLSLRHSFSWQKWAAMLSALVVWQGTPAFSQNADSLNTMQVEKEKGKKEWIVKGRVVDRANETIKYSSIRVSMIGTSIYTLTDEFGNFSLNLSHLDLEKTTLIFEAEDHPTFLYPQKVKIKRSVNKLLLVKMKPNKKGQKEYLTPPEIIEISDENVDHTAVTTQNRSKPETCDTLMGAIIVGHWVDSLAKNDTLKPEQIQLSMIEFEVANTEFIEDENTEFTEATYSYLQEIAEFLISNPTIYISFRVHTNNTLSTTEGQILSEKRAKVIYDYLVSKGIATKRLAAKGYGNSRPLPAGTGRKQERVEIRLWIREE